jgi:hypothetical protein
MPQKDHKAQPAVGVELCWVCFDAEVCQWETLMVVFLVIYVAEDERQEMGKRLELDKEGTECSRLKM